jgi:UPF0176 protein
MKNQYRVLLYYKYVLIDNPEQFAEDHLKFCKDLGLKGRILVAGEGINGTVSGTVEQTDRYMSEMKNDPRFEDMVFKIDESEGHAFKKMHVRQRDELVTLRLEDDIDPNELTGKYLEPKEFYEAMQREGRCRRRHGTTMSTIWDISAARSDRTLRRSANCLNGSVITKKSSKARKY